MGLPASGSRKIGEGVPKEASFGVKRFVAAKLGIPERERCQTVYREDHELGEGFAGDFESP